MLSNNKTDLVYCLRILEAIGKINIYAADYNDPFTFFEANDQKEFNACLLQLLHIGEQTNRLSEELKIAYPEVAWQLIKAFRNVVAHDYVGVDKLVVYQTIKQSLPDLKQAFERIIQTELIRGIFDQTDYDISRNSTYYRHIDFSRIN